MLFRSQFDRSGATATFGKGICTILSPGQLTITGTRIGNLYILDKCTIAYTSTAMPVGLGSMMSAGLESTMPAGLGSTMPATEAPGLGSSKKRKRPKDQLLPSTVTVTAKSVAESELCHRRFAHLNPVALQFIINGFTYDGAMCDICVQVKYKQKFIRTKVTRTTKPFELVHQAVTIITSSHSLTITHAGQMHGYYLTRKQTPVHRHIKHFRKG